MSSFFIPVHFCCVLQTELGGNGKWEWAKRRLPVVAGLVFGAGLLVREHFRPSSAVHVHIHIHIHIHSRVRGSGHLHQQLRLCVCLSPAFFSCFLAHLLTSHGCREGEGGRVASWPKGSRKRQGEGCRDKATKTTRLTLGGSHPHRRSPTHTRIHVWAYHTVANSPCAMQHFFSCVLACFVLLRFFAILRFCVGPTPKAAALLSLSSTFAIAIAVAVALTPRLCAARFSISIDTHIYLY